MQARLVVLVIDDSPVVRHALGRRLIDQGFVVRLEESAAAAREADPDALLCAIVDLELGDDHGTELAAELLARRPSLPVAFFTAGAIPAERTRALARGPVFEKPNLDAVVAWVARAAQPPPTK